MTTQAERITSLEVENRQLKDEVKGLRDDVRKLTVKLDELLTLKAKGQGAFWLATLIFGTSIAGAISYLVSYFK